MKTKEELELEMKNLMDLEVARMRVRHFDLMCWAIPRGIGLIILMGAIFYIFAK